MRLVSFGFSHFCKARCLTHRLITLVFPVEICSVGTIRRGISFTMTYFEYEASLLSLRDAFGTLPCRASHRRGHMDRFAARYLVTENIIFNLKPQQFFN